MIADQTARRPASFRPPFTLAGLTAAMLAALSMAGAARAAETPYPAMAPVAAYMAANAADEVVLARSAAPPAISQDAEVLVLGAHGYEVAAKGRNGFVCVVERSWAADFSDLEYWNSKIRAPICFNPASARSVLPTYLRQTAWLLAGASRAELIDRTKAALAAHELTAPASGAMCFMMSRQGYVNDKSAGPWKPHLMFFTPRSEPGAWGANLPGVPVMGGGGGEIDQTSVFFVPVGTWSDGAPASGPAHVMANM